MWELFYPPLSFINEDDVINIVVVWDMKADKLVFWCVIDEREVNDIVIQRTTAATEPFGMALAPSEMNAPLDLLFE